MAAPNFLQRLWGDIAIRVAGYYAVLLGLGVLIWNRLPKDAAGLPTGPFAELLGGHGADVLSKSAAKEVFAEQVARGSSVAPVDIALTTSLAVVTALLLTLPVAWIYTYTRRKKGFQQTMVQTLLILPVVVAGIVMMVKHSVALAFSLGAIVAAVRFRTSLDDSKDAVYVFLVMGIGIASGVEITVAIVLSVLFNAVVLGLWYTDFGRAPAMEGARAQKQLDRALSVANRTGMFMSKLDDEVLKTLSPDQLDVLADRAWRRKKRMTEDTKESERPVVDVLLRLKVEDVDTARAVTEPLLDNYMLSWRYSGTHKDDDGGRWIEYGATLLGNVLKQEVLFDLRTKGAPHVLKVELR